MSIYVNCTDSFGEFVANQPATLPPCDCDLYMPQGQHDPYQHAALERSAIEQSNMAMQRAAEEARNTALMCSCKDFMPPGQHDPLSHDPVDRAAISEANQIITAARANQGNEEYPQDDAGKDAMKLLWKARGRWAERMSHSHELKLLRETLVAESGRSHFTCGGSISVARSDDKGKGRSRQSTPHELQQASIKPVSIRWGRDGRTLTLPLKDGDQYLNEIARDCAPATFGRNGKDVYDESYRRAGALGVEDFMTDFCPYSAGIIESITQLLLPSTSDMFSERKIRAELYKLNVYSGPSGLFKPHVDTPRSSQQIGSLVVCLPATFEGGALAVRHKGHEVVHDWADVQHDKAPSIQWAAFYSDCEHEVLEVTAGHRITLTYNLFLAPSPGLLGGVSSTFLPESLPLTRQLKSLLDNPIMWPHGGYIGIHMAHSYPHTHECLYELIPRMLKGTDMAVYAAVSSLGLAGLLTSADYDKRHLVLEDLESRERGVPGMHRTGSTIYNDLEPVDIDRETQHEKIDDEFDPTSASSDSDGYNSGYCGNRERWFEKREAMRADRQICWLNKAGHRELSKAFMAYGNNAELDVKYSSIALVVKIPTFDARSVARVGSKEEPMIVE